MILSGNNLITNLLCVFPQEYADIFMEDKMNKKNIYPNWFLVAPFLLYIIFFLVPALLGVVYSFTDWNVRSRGTISFIGIIIILKYLNQIKIMLQEF